MLAWNKVLVWPDTASFSSQGNGGSQGWFQDHVYVKLTPQWGEMSFLNGYGKMNSQLFMNTIVKNEVDNK